MLYIYGEMNDSTLHSPPLINVLFCIQIPIQRKTAMESWGSKFLATPGHSDDR